MESPQEYYETTTKKEKYLYETYEYIPGSTQTKKPDNQPEQ